MAERVEFEEPEESNQIFTNQSEFPPADGNPEFIPAERTRIVSKAEQSQQDPNLYPRFRPYLEETIVEIEGVLTNRPYLGAQKQRLTVVPYKPS